MEALAALVRAEPNALVVTDDQGCTALHWACYTGNSNCVTFMLRQRFITSLDILLEGIPHSLMNTRFLIGS